MTTPEAELAALRAHLQRALCLLLITPVGCTSGSSTDDTPTAKQPARGDLAGPTATSSDASTTTPPLQPINATPPEPIATPPEPIEPDLKVPSCPSGAWCGTETLVAPLRREDQYATADFEGCAGSLLGQSLAEAELVAYGDLPVASNLIATIDVEASKTKRVAQPDACCYTWTLMCPGGRPLLDDGEPQVASLRSGSSWTAELPTLDRAAIARLPSAARRALAGAWLADARMEHASIASFERARLELAAVGAPEGLLLACEHAAVDERRHARIGFGLVAAYGGPAVEPERLVAPPIRPGGLIRVALDVFLEGCVGETVAAACVRRAASEADDPALARLLERIADDEGDHAALAWQTLAWAIDRGGAPVCRAIAALADRLRPSESARVDDRELAPGHGQLDAVTLARVRHDAWAAIIDPLVRDLTRL